eukprot:gnl/TRDRNA2_/TRDRNA2_29995_c0_seq1.p1 gnl/TRDRNA2_/TRDRNA2_29995_c0~~gnl/TRDRNA2_/TRDRNA2_29995_c0_seq1.p1  ORF type:complete len:114 (+),score=13.12 gnl/TRDRNA2_/TRDRNA2_29995_c0_seq1:71-412(+)
MAVAVRRLALQLGKQQRFVGQLTLTGKSTVSFTNIMDIEDVDKMFEPLLNLIGGRKPLAQIGCAADSSADKVIEVAKKGPSKPRAHRSGPRCQTCTNCGACARTAQMLEGIQW